MNFTGLEREPRPFERGDPAIVFGNVESLK
jgi:hypothetical protein